MLVNIHNIQHISKAATSYSAVEIDDIKPSDPIEAASFQYMAVVVSRVTDAHHVPASWAV